MANKVLFEIEVDAKFQELKQLQTEMDRLQKQQKESAKAGQKDTARYQSNKIALKELGAQHRAVSKEVKVNRNATKQLGTSYNALTEQNRKLSQTLRSIKDPLGKNKKLFQETAKQIDNNTNKLKQMDNAMGRQQRNVGNYGSALGGLGKSFLSSAAGALGLVGGVQLAFNAIGNGINTIKEFEQAGANLKAVLGDLATEDNILKLADDAKRLGASTAFSATEVRTLQTEFAKLGFDPKAIVNATEATLDLAAATGTDLAEAASVAGGTLGAFELGASQTGRVADVMAKSFSISALDMEKFSESMKNAAPAAHAVGLSVEETTALLGTLSKANITGSKAGSNLATGFINLKAKGIDLNDALEKIKGSAEPLSGAVNLVGKNAAKSFLVLANGQKTTEGYIQSLNDAEGAAHDMAKTQLDTLDGALKILSSSYEGLILSMEDGNGVMSNIAKIIVQDVSTALSLLSGNVSAADEKFSYLSIVITQIKLSFNLLKNVLKLVYLPFQALGKLVVKVGQHFGFMKESADGVGDSLLFLQQVFVRLPAIMDIVVKGITNSFLGVGEVVMELGRQIAKTFSIDTVKAILAGENPLKVAFGKVSDAAVKVFNNGLGKIKGEVEALWDKEDNKKALDDAEDLGFDLGTALTDGVKKGIKESSKSSDKIELTSARTLDVEKLIESEKETAQEIQDIKIESEIETQTTLGIVLDNHGKLLADKGIALAQQTSNAIFDIQKRNVDRQADYKKRQLEIQDTFERELLESRLESGSISQAEYENNLIALKERTDAENEAIEREAFERKKRLDTAQALINGALAVTRIMADVNKADYGVATAIMIGAQIAATGVEVAAIQSQQFADGGLLQGASHENGGIPFTVDGQAGFEAEGGEVIINKRSVQMFGNELDYINRAGGGVSLFENGGYVKKFANGGLVSQGGMSQVDLTRQAEILAQQINNIKVVNVASETQAVNSNSIKIENEYTL